MIPSPEAQAVMTEELSEDIKAFADSLDLKNKDTIYGVPKNGTIIAWKVVHYLYTKDIKTYVTYNPKRATVIVDDLIDSGRTMQKYVQGYGKPFEAVYYKQDKHKNNGCKKKDEWIIFPWEADPLQNDDQEKHVVRILEMIGEQPDRNGLKDTPKRYLKALKEMTRGYEQDVSYTVFEKDGFDQIVILKDIKFFSLCEHHLLPFHGNASVAYIPNKKIVGVSKLARVVEKFACRLQNQERIAEQISDELTRNLEPRGLAVILNGMHSCVACRGVRQVDALMTTSKITGIFREDHKARSESFQLLSNASL